MSRPDISPVPGSPGQPIALDLAPFRSGASHALVRPLAGQDELTLTERLDEAASMTAVQADTLVLCTGVAELSGLSGGPSALDALLLGDRNRLVLALLCASYGAPDTLLMECLTDDCGAKHEVLFDTAMILNTVPAGPAGETIEIRLRGWTVRDVAAHRCRSGSPSSGRCVRCLRPLAPLCAGRARGGSRSRRD